MKVSKSKFYIILFVIIVLFQIYAPFRLNIIIQSTVLVLFFLFEEFAISKKIYGILSPLVLIFSICLLGILFNNYRPINILKDIFHVVKPILGLLIGYLFFYKINDFRLFVKSIVITALICAVIHISQLFISGNIFGDLSSIREFKKDNFLEMIALFLMHFSYGNYKKVLFTTTLKYNLIFYFILLSCVLYFSRTMIVTSIIFWLSLKGYAKIDKKSLRLIGLFSVFIALLYVYLFSIKINRDEKGVFHLLYKIKMAPGEIFTSKIDRENHKDLWDHWRAYEASRALDLMSKNPVSYIIGNGMGSLVNLKMFAPLSNDTKGLKYISELHNGYIYVFYKSGIIGLFLYLVFLFRFYIPIYKTSNLINNFNAAIAMFFLFSSITITGIYNFADVLIFILGAATVFYNRQINLY